MPPEASGPAAVPAAVEPGDELPDSLLDAFTDFMFGQEPTDAQSAFSAAVMEPPPFRAAFEARLSDAKAGGPRARLLARDLSRRPEFHQAAARFPNDPLFRLSRGGRAPAAGSSPPPAARIGAAPIASFKAARPSPAMINAFRFVEARGAMPSAGALGRAIGEAKALARVPPAPSRAAPEANAVLSPPRAGRGAAAPLARRAEEGALAPLAKRPEVPFREILDPSIFTLEQIDALLAGCIDRGLCEFWAACLAARLEASCDKACARAPNCEPRRQAAALPAAPASRAADAAPGPGGGDDGGGQEDFGSGNDAPTGASSPAASHYEAILWTESDGSVYLGVIEVGPDGSASFVDSAAAPNGPSDDAQYWTADGTETPSPF